MKINAKNDYSCYKHCDPYYFIPNDFKRFMLSSLIKASSNTSDVKEHLLFTIKEMDSISLIKTFDLVLSNFSKK